MEPLEIKYLPTYNKKIEEDDIITNDISEDNNWGLQTIQDISSFGTQVSSVRDNTSLSLGREPVTTNKSKVEIENSVEASPKESSTQAVTPKPMPYTGSFDIKNFIKKEEGNFVSQDAGKGATNKGVTINTFRSIFGSHKTVEDLKNITDEEWDKVFDEVAYKPIKGNQIKNNSVRNAIIDWAWNSGPKTAIKQIQEAIRVHKSGKMDETTLAAINNFGNQQELFNLIQSSRKAFLNRLADTKASLAKYRGGWNRRVDNLVYTGRMGLRLPDIWRTILR